MIAADDIDISSLTVKELDKLILKTERARVKILNEKTNAMYPDVKRVFEKHEELFCSTYFTKPIKVKLVPCVFSQINSSFEFPYKEMRESREFKEYSDKVSKALNEIEPDEFYDMRLKILNDLIIKNEYND